MFSFRRCSGQTLGLLVFFACVPTLWAQGPGAPANLDQAIHILDRARQNFKQVKDYECKMIKQERIRGTLLPESQWSVKARSEPFSVFMSCDSPGPDKGTEVCYVTGKNHDNMRLHPPGSHVLFGFVTLKVKDPRVMEKNRHAITEAGLAYLLESTAKAWEMERMLNRTQVKMDEDQVGRRPCLRIESIHPERCSGAYYGYRCILWLDRETLLPTGSEAYDWPHTGGPATGELLEKYRYVGIRTNVGLGEKVFNH